MIDVDEWRQVVGVDATAGDRERRASVYFAKACVKEVIAATFPASSYFDVCLMSKISV